MGFMSWQDFAHNDTGYLEAIVAAESRPGDNTISNKRMAWQEQVLNDPTLVKIRPYGNGGSTLYYQDGTTRNLTRDDNAGYLYYKSPDLIRVEQGEGDLDKFTFADGTVEENFSPRREATSGNFFESGNWGPTLIGAVIAAYGGALAAPYLGAGAAGGVGAGAIGAGEGTGMMLGTASAADIAASSAVADAAIAAGGYGAAGGAASGMFSGPAAGAEAGTGMMAGAETGGALVYGSPEFYAAGAQLGMGAGETASLTSTGLGGMSAAAGSGYTGSTGMTALQKAQLVKAGLGAVSQLAGGGGGAGSGLMGNYGAGTQDNQLRPQAMAIPQYMRQPDIQPRPKVDPYMEYLKRQQAGYFGGGGILA
jgi:hypothetical protein